MKMWVLGDFSGHMGSIIIRYEDIGLVIAFLMGREYTSLR